MPVLSMKGGEQSLAYGGSRWPMVVVVGIGGLLFPGGETGWRWVCSSFLILLCVVRCVQLIIGRGRPNQVGGVCIFGYQ